METVVGYMVVAEGGEYSDAYHYNKVFYLDRSEAEAYIESQRELTSEWNKFVAACPRYVGFTNEDWDKVDVLYPPGIPNRNRLVNSWRENYERELHAAWKIEVETICKESFPHLLLEIKSGRSIYAEDENTDLYIEEIEIPNSSRLYRLLKGTE